jgi:hypothetical protein
MDEIKQTDKKLIEDIKETKKQDTACRKELSELKEQNARIITRIASLEKEIGVLIPKKLSDLLQVLIGDELQGKEFEQEKLKLDKPKRKDPIVKYDGKILCWFLYRNSNSEWSEHEARRKDEGKEKNEAIEPIAIHVGEIL